MNMKQQVRNLRERERDGGQSDSLIYTTLYIFSFFYNFVSLKNVKGAFIIKQFKSYY